MHDLIHDFAESTSSSETVIFNEEYDNSIASNIRHLNLINCGETMPKISGGAAMKLLTLLSSKHLILNSVQEDPKRLRVLIVHDASDAKQLTKCFGNSKSLRYLDFSGSKIEELPKFIKKLYNLQTLRLMNCESLRMPPEGLGKLIKLRHIYFSDEDRMPVHLGRLTYLQTLNLFFVGKTKGRKIEELRSLNKLRGRLAICKLELVEGKSEAKSAKLYEKELDELRLEWSRNEDCDENDVLEELQPHSKWQKLYIEGFGGKNLPSWMLKSRGRFHPNNLVVLKLKRCKKLENIPVVEGFSSLRELSIEYCEELSYGVFTFQSLKTLSIERCPNVKSFSYSGLTSLEELHIFECGVVNIIGDGLSSCKHLKVLMLEYCPKLNIPRLHRLSSLRRVEIRACDELTCLPSGLSSCTALEELFIVDCPNLVSVPEELKELHSLVELWIYDCPKLSSFPEEILGFLSKLKTLGIGGFSNELEEFPGLGSINNLSASLEHLSLEGWQKLVTQFPHQVQALTSLKTLQISDFNGVEALPEWLGELSCLESLIIQYCSGLKSLHSGIPSCASLEKLYIIGCDNLISVPGELKELCSLVDLDIYRCPKLRSFSEEVFGGLAPLETLRIGGFSEDLDEFIGLSSIHLLHASLEVLSLHGCEKLTELPQQIQHLTALRQLTFADFKGVEVLPDWLGNLPSLQSLTIWGCENLKIMPSAETIKRLSKLNRLSILPDWPELQKHIEQEKQSTIQNQ